MKFNKAKKQSKQTQARKVLLELTTEQARLLASQSKIVNWCKNKLFEEVTLRFNNLSALAGDAFKFEPDAEVQAYVREQLNTIYSNQGLRDLIPQLKQRHPFLKSVFSSCLKNIGLNLTQTIQMHQQGKGGWPSYSSWAKKWTSLYYDEPQKGWSVKKSGSLKLSFGVDVNGGRLATSLKLVKPPPHLDNAKTCRIIREGTHHHPRYYAVFTFTAEASKVKSPKVPKLVYLDPNIKNLAYGLTATGEAFEVANLEPLKFLEKQIDKVKAKRDGCTKKSRWVDTVRDDGTVGTHYLPSHRWAKLNHVVVNLERKMREQKKHFIGSLASKLCRDFDIIGIGDYVPANSDHGKGRKYNRAMRNRAMQGSFKRQLAWTASKSGKLCSVLDESGTTRTCHQCDHIVQGGLDPSIRVWRCAQCKTIHIRDENACQNGLAELASLYQVPCSGPVKVVSRCDWTFCPEGWRVESVSNNKAVCSSGGADESNSRDPYILTL